MNPRNPIHRHVNKTLFLILTLCSGRVAFAVEHVTYWNQSPGRSWDDPSIWSPNDGLAPHPGDTYTVSWIGFTPQSTVRNPIDGNDVVFGGDSLTIRGDSQVNLYAKSPGVDTKITFGRSGLIFTYGYLRAREDVKFTIDGLISFTNDDLQSKIWTRSDQPDASNIGSFKLDAELHGAGLFLLVGGRASSPTVEITGNNANFSGRVGVSGGWLHLSGQGSLGSASVILNSANIPTIFDSDYDIVSPGTFEALGASSIRLDQHLTFDRVIIGYEELERGTYTAEELIARFPSFFAAIGEGSTITGKITTVQAPEVGAATALLWSGLLCTLLGRFRRANA